jgi:hypothetical protein
LPEKPTLSHPFRGHDHDVSDDQDEQQRDDTKSATSDGWTGMERRRAGRVNFANPHLIALLRGKTPTGDTIDAPNRAAERDDLGPAKGIMLAAAVSAVIWGAVVLIVGNL